MVNQFETLKDEIIAELFMTPSHQIRPRDLEERLNKKRAASAFTVREAVKSLVSEGELAYTYRDPFDYIEIAPARTHHAARPMNVVLDSQGNPWICDAGVTPSRASHGESCWSCGEVPFTRDD